jgi:hypothetical protein
VFENKVLRRIFGPKGRKGREVAEYCVMRTSLNIIKAIKLRRM